MLSVSSSPAKSDRQSISAGAGSRRRARSAFPAMNETNEAVFRGERGFVRFVLFHKRRRCRDKRGFVHFVLFHKTALPGQARLRSFRSFARTGAGPVPLPASELFKYRCRCLRRPKCPKSCFQSEGNAISRCRHVAARPRACLPAPSPSRSVFRAAVCMRSPAAPWLSVRGAMVHNSPGRVPQNVQRENGAISLLRAELNEKHEADSRPTWAPASRGIERKARSGLLVRLQLRGMN